MGIGSKILNVFVESGAGESAPVLQAQASKTATSSNAPPAPVTPIFVAGAVNPDMQNDIMTAISAADLPGYDYLELMEALKNMAALPFTDEQKIMAAFAAVANQTSRDKILSSITHYVGIIDDCEKNFLERALQKEQNQVTGREDQIKALDAEVEATSKQILDLTAKIN